MKEAKKIFDRLTVGTCYYPEHWPEELWASDMRRMKESGIDIIRIAEFAWALMEPADGVFDFVLFDRFLEVAKEYDVKVIFGTPTATPPAWLTHAHPEVLNANREGQLYRHGVRRHYNYNSPVYRMYTARIVEKMAEHFGSHPSIIGWQVDNELNCEIDEFYSARDQEAFRQFLKKRYVTLEALNQAWGTVFWSQTYTDWNQVYLPRLTAHHSVNPHHALDEKRFISESAIEFARLQADILRKYIGKEQFITTNGMFGHLDNHRMTRDVLDLYTYDSYPAFGSGNETGLRDRKWSMNLSVVRSIDPHFGIMEQQSGAGGWHDRMRLRSPRPGQMRLWAFQSIAHGADFISFFRWRTCTFGTEMYWHGILNYDNQDNRKLAEVKQFTQDVQKVHCLAESDYVASVATLRDYDNEWDGERDGWVGPLRRHSELAWFEACTLTHTPMDFVYMDETITLDRLKRYELLVYPHPTITSEQTAALLKEYVEQGGRMILGARSGYKDTNGHCPMVPTPGPLRELCGCEVRDFTALVGADRAGISCGEVALQACDCVDILTPVSERATVIGSFRTEDYMNGLPAVVETPTGSGLCVLYGSGFSYEAACMLLRRYNVIAPESDILSLPKECELAVRWKNGTKYWVVLNYDGENTLTLHKPLVEMLSERELCGECHIPEYGVMVLTEK